MREVPAGQFHKLSSQTCCGFVGKPAKHDVTKAVNLIFGRRHEPGVRVPVARSPPGTHAVDDSSAVGELEKGTISADDFECRRAGCGIRMPDVGGVHRRYLNTVQKLHLFICTTSESCA